MSDDDALVRETESLLAPGEIDLSGVIVHTDCSRDEELEMMSVTVDVGELIAEHAGRDDVYVYSGNDDPSFGVNQHQGRSMDDDSFVWECQQILRDGSFDVVFYYRSSIDQDALVAALRSRSFRVTSVTVD